MMSSATMETRSIDLYKVEIKLLVNIKAYESNSSERCGTHGEAV